MTVRLIYFNFSSERNNERCLSHVTMPSKKGGRNLADFVHRPDECHSVSRVLRNETISSSMASNPPPEKDGLVSFVRPPCKDLRSRGDGGAAAVRILEGSGRQTGWATEGGHENGNPTTRRVIRVELVILHVNM